MRELLNQVKENLILEHNEDDRLIEAYIATAISYAEGFQHRYEGYYQNESMSAATRQAVIMIASHLYESRDGSTAGFYGDNTAAAQQVWETVHNLLRMDRDWKV